MTEEAELVVQDAWKTMEMFWKSGHQVDFLIKKNWNCIQEILEQFMQIASHHQMLTHSLKPGKSRTF